METTTSNDQLLLRSAIDTQTQEKIADLALQVRRDTVRSIACAGAGHPGGALGAADIFAVLYGHAMNHSSERPDDPGRDRFVLSNGHICAAFYSILARCGYFEVDELASLRKINGRLQGHPARSHLPKIVETSSGPLGQGLSVANGLAMAARLDRLDSRIFCLSGDGELQEGQIWEALMTAAQFGLSNMTFIVSYNGLQIDGALSQVMQIDPLAAKFGSFGIRVLEIDGHDIQEIIAAIEDTGKEDDRPTAIIARTVMGKGVPFMENKAQWHGGKLSWDQAEEALNFLCTATWYSDFTVTDGRGASA